MGSLPCMDERHSTAILLTLLSGDKQEDSQELGDFRISQSDHTDEETGEWRGANCPGCSTAAEPDRGHGLLVLSIFLPLLHGLHFTIIIKEVMCAYFRITLEFMLSTLTLQ